MTDPLVTLKAIEQTRQRLSPHILSTPVHYWKGREIDERVGLDTHPCLKLELFQYTGTFKVRGALSVMLGLDRDALKRGVTAVSAGNHAIATAFAARQLGSTAKVVMVASANVARIERCRSYGAEILLAPDGKSAFALAEQIASDEGRTFVHPFEGPLTTLGTATIGAEFHEQAGPMDAVIIPIGGGGLCSGVAAALKQLQPACRVFGVEPIGANVMHRSFASGHPEACNDIATIADSLAPPYTLPYSYSVCHKYVDELTLVDDDQLRDAMAILFREMKLAVEPAGAAATAALLGPLRERLRGKRVGLIICGANIDIESFAKHVIHAQMMCGRR